MTKFGHYLTSYQVPEWAHMYIDYSKLKKLLEDIVVNDADSSSASAPMAGLPLNQLGDADVVIDEPILAGNEPSDVGYEAQRRMMLADLEAGAAAREDDEELGDAGGIIHAGLSAQLKEPAAGEADSSGQRPGKPVTDMVPAKLARRPAELAFFEAVQHELDKIEAFFRAQERAFANRTNVLVAQINQYRDMCRDVGSKKEGLLKGTAALLDRALREHFRGLDLLRNFRLLNYTGFVKILKKHDKMSFDFKNSSVLILPSLASSYWYKSPFLETMTIKTEQLYVQGLYGGDRSRALAKLKVNVHQVSVGTTFRLGVYVGLILSLVVVLNIMTRLVPSINDSNYLNTPMPLYRMMVLLNLAVWLWGVVVFLCDRYRVNYLFVLEANTRTALTFTQIWEVAAAMSMAILSVFCLYLLDFIHGASGGDGVGYVGYLNAALFWGVVAAFAAPFNILYHHTRFWLCRNLLAVLKAGFVTVDFRSLFLADQLTSLVRAELDLFYSACFCTTGDFLTIESARCTRLLFISRYFVSFLPYYFRMAQCLRRWRDTGSRLQLANAGKYASSLHTTFWSLLANWDAARFQGMWIFSAVLATIYSAVWDIRVDWGFLEEGPWKHGGLRRRRVIEYPVFYYWAAVSNTLLRVAWVFTISPGALGLTLNGELFKLLIGSLEVFRRSQWSFLRLEAEHLLNVENFRAVADVPLPFGTESAEGAKDMLAAGAVAGPTLAFVRQESRDGGAELSSSRRRAGRSQSVSFKAPTPTLPAANFSDEEELELQPPLRATSSSPQVHSSAVPSALGGLMRRSSSTAESGLEDRASSRGFPSAVESVGQPPAPQPQQSRSPTPQQPPQPQAQPTRPRPEAEVAPPPDREEGPIEEIELPESAPAHLSSINTASLLDTTAAAWGALSAQVGPSPLTSPSPAAVLEALTEQDVDDATQEVRARPKNLSPKRRGSMRSINNSNPPVPPLLHAMTVPVAASTRQPASASPDPDSSTSKSEL